MTFDGGPARGELGTSDLLWTYSPLQPAKRVYLAPGQLFASGDARPGHDDPRVVRGRVPVGQRGGGRGSQPLPAAARRAAVATLRGPRDPTLLLKRVLALGAEHARLRAKLFGGACVLEALRASSALGARNVEVARERLSAEGIRVVAEDIGRRPRPQADFRSPDGLGMGPGHRCELPAVANCPAKGDEPC